MAFRSAVPLGRGTDLRRPRQRLPKACCSSCPTPFQTKPFPNHRCTVRWATPVKEWIPSAHAPQAACPPATELSGPCSLNAHFVPLSTGLIDINSCAQSAHSVFSWSDAVGVCVIKFNGNAFQVGMKYEQFGHRLNDNLCYIHWKWL